MPNTKTTVSALVSPQDYDKLIDITDVWHVSSSGYVVYSKRTQNKTVVTYMHREVLGAPGRHINGDRFDNRRCNLRFSNRSPGKRVQDMKQDDLLKIKTVSPLLDHELDPTEIPSESKYCTVRYSPDMVYKGELLDCKPHGFGTLLEDSKAKVSLGWWMQGTFRSGLVVYVAPIPEKMREDRPIPQIRQACLVVNGEMILS